MFGDRKPMTQNNQDHETKRGNEFTLNNQDKLGGSNVMVNKRDKLQ